MEREARPRGDGLQIGGKDAGAGVVQMPCDANNGKQRWKTSKFLWGSSSPQGFRGNPQSMYSDMFLRTFGDLAVGQAPMPSNEPLEFIWDSRDN